MSRIDSSSQFRKMPRTVCNIRFQLSFRFLTIAMYAATQADDMTPPKKAMANAARFSSGE